MLCKHVIEINKPADQRQRHHDKPQADHLKQQCFHGLQGRHHPDDAAGLFVMKLTILHGQRQRLQRSNTEHAVGNDRDQNMQLQGRRTAYR